MVRYALRTLRRSPGYTAAAVLTLALGIGANTAIVSVVDAVLLKSLPYPDPGRLVFINEQLPKSGMLNVSWPDFQDWRAQNQVFERMAIFQPNKLAYRGRGEPRLIPVAYADPELFPVLGAQPILGRGLSD